jgi:hypothetical protein
MSEYKEIAWLSDECLLCKNPNPQADFNDDLDIEQLCTPHFMRLAVRWYQTTTGKELPYR